LVIRSSLFQWWLVLLGRPGFAGAA